MELANEGVDWVELAKDRCSNTGILYTALVHLSDHDFLWKAILCVSV